MKERRHIVERWRLGELSSLITLVQARGSSYRRPGARMLIGRHGEYVGSISGGCLEAEMARKSAWAVQNGAVVRHVTTEFDDSAEIPYGLGCGGVLDLLIEPADTPEFDSLMIALETSLSGGSRRVITWLPDGASPLRRLVLDEGGATLFASSTLADCERRQAMRGDPHASPETIFSERLEAPQRLIIAGAGDDARPLVSLAALLGWEVLVLDGRAHLAREERFPQATRVIATAPERFRNIGVRPDDAVVVMTHSYEQDREAIIAFVGVRPRYLGLLGARLRSAMLLQEVAAATGVSLDLCCEAVHAPIGLDLGGDGAEAIALAIVAEVQACCMGKPSGPLRLSATTIARYLEQPAPVAAVGTRCALEAG